MDSKVLLSALGMWFIFVIAAILNGTLRIAFITPRVGEYAGHVISTIIFMCVILAGTYIFLSYLDAGLARNDLLLIGAFWLVLTVVFEFVFGHYVMGHSWDKLLADYNIFKGRVWVLVLLTTFLAPWLVGTYLRK
jgi:hypothetical protein